MLILSNQIIRNLIRLDWARPRRPRPRQSRLGEKRRRVFQVICTNYHTYHSVSSGKPAVTVPEFLRLNCIGRIRHQGFGMLLRTKFRGGTDRRGRKPGWRILREYRLSHVVLLSRDLGTGMDDQHI